MSDFEKLGAFYLGRRYDADSNRITDETILYDAKDLTTHALCVGMTGSGKTGLGISLLEEAAIDGIPIIAIDPKGDLGNLLLTFPQLRASDFRPWIDESEALRKGRSPDEQAKWTADLWRNGLGEWGQAPDRIGTFANAADRTIYTPGSQAGRPVAVLRSFAAPPPAVIEDGDAFRTRVQSAVSGLLALLGIDADPIRSREHILLSTLLGHAWQEGRDLDLASLIREIQSPPVSRVGVFDLDTFYPANDRFELAMMLNNIIASPGFSTWLEGDALDIQKMLYGPGGKPRIAIFSIAHLSDAERMFFVTILLNEILTWTRSQPGSRSLRAIVYMDEIFGYFPPTANPPSKTPMLTLLKQARAFGVGMVLCTQNPVDLDYKGLSNCGTWFIGRLQTERDKGRVLDGLEGASASAGGGFDRGKMERTLAGLGSRVFLLNNVHEDAPVLMHTRWVLSYLAGPLTRAQMKMLADSTPSADPAAEVAAPPLSSAASPSATDQRRAAPIARADAATPDGSERPILPSEIGERFLEVSVASGAADRLLYRPALIARATTHYVQARMDLDEWRRVTLLAPLDESTASAPWSDAQTLAGHPTLARESQPGVAFGELPAAAMKTTQYRRWEKMLKTHLYKEFALSLWTSKKPKLASRAGESEDAFRGRLADALRESRDLALEKLRAKFAPKVQRLEARILRAEQTVEKEREQLSHSRTHTAVSVGATLLGAVFGRKIASRGNIGRASTAISRVSRAKKEEGDVERALERLEEYRAQLGELTADFERALDEVRDEMVIDKIDVATKNVAPRKSDLSVDELHLVWVPWRVDSDGIASIAADLVD